MDEAEIVNGLQSLARANGASSDLHIGNLKRVRGGNSSEIWAFDGLWEEHGSRIDQPLILRSGADNEFSVTGRDMELRVLQALAPSGLPVPRIYWSDYSGAHFKRQTMIMQRCAGFAERTALGDKNRGGLNAQQRAALGLEMIDLLARLHAVDASGLDDGDTAENPAAAQLKQNDSAIEAMEVEPMVELRVASCWLWRNLPPAPARRTIVHGDFRPANMLIDRGRVSAILDWEFTHIGDPLEDLGWYLSPYYTAEHLIPGALSEDDVIRRYEAATGQSVDRHAVQFWSVHAIYKLAYMTVAALRWMAEGDASRMTPSARFILKPLLAAIVAADRKAQGAAR